MTTTDLHEALDRLYACLPDRLGPLSLVCTCDQCLPPDALHSLQSTPLRSLPPEAVSHWFAAAPSYHDDGRPIGPFTTGTAADHWPEALAMLVKVLEALGNEIATDGHGLSTLGRDWWFVEPERWTRRLLACDLRTRLPAAARGALDRALMVLADEALATGSVRLLDTLEYLGAFGRGLPALVDWLESQPLRSQLKVWAQVLGGRACAPDARAGRAWEDFRTATHILPIPLADRLNRAAMNPRLGALLFRAALVLRDPSGRDLAECAYMLWENSVAAMRLPADPRR
ncbi:MAG: hypothetical protein KDK12_15185 [Rhodobacteraceae bacterium]|nr:hypothetical protein [Paracoccaceae bacterium]